jgi:hypothetical protein
MSNRSHNGELHEGATDGKYRKVRPNTHVAPGLGDELVRANRASLHPFFNYGFIDTEETKMVSPGEANVKASRVPSFSSTPVADIDNNMMGQTY